MAPAVAREEHHWHAIENAGDVGVTGRAKGRREFDLAHILEPFEFIEAGASDYADRLRLSHGRSADDGVCARAARGGA